jgi:hypothetical protein
MRQEDNIYNNRVYRDKCHNNQSIYYIAEVLLQNKRINIKRTKDRPWRRSQLGKTPPRSDQTPRFVAPPEPPVLLLWGV